LEKCKEVGFFSTWPTDQPTHTSNVFVEPEKPLFRVTCIRDQEQNKAHIGSKWQVRPWDRLQT
jgi:hypothetical protein